MKDYQDLWRRARWRPVAAVLLALALLGLCLLALAWAAPAGAQIESTPVPFELSQAALATTEFSCVSPTYPVGGWVRVVPGAGLNVRPNPGGNVPGNVRTSVITGADGWLKVDARNGEYLHIVDEGWIWDHYLEVDCKAVPTSTPAPQTPTGTLAPSATFTPRPSPTRYSTSTPLPPAALTQMAEQWVTVVCVQWGAAAGQGQSGVCFDYPFDAWVYVYRAQRNR
jgi:hypothetical protein